MSSVESASSLGRMHNGFGKSRLARCWYGATAFAAWAGMTPHEENIVASEPQVLTIHGPIRARTAAFQEYIGSPDHRLLQVNTQINILLSLGIYTLCPTYLLGTNS